MSTPADNESQAPSVVGSILRQPQPMDNYPPTHPLIEADRPPGGTRRSGMKTPRKVQWLDHDEDNSPDAARALDEHGVDVRAFFFC